MIHLDDSLWAIKIPDDLLSPEYAIERSIGRMIDIEKGDDELVIRYIKRECGSPKGKLTFDIPPGSWRIVCTSRDVTEDQLKDVIPEMKVGKRYPNYNGDYPIWYHSRRESLSSLMKSKGCDLFFNYLILKKQ